MWLGTEPHTSSVSSKGQSIVMAHDALIQRHLDGLGGAVRMSPQKSGCCWLCRNKIFGLIIENLLGITSLQLQTGHIVAKVWLHALSFVLERSCRQSKQRGVGTTPNHVPLCKERGAF